MNSKTILISGCSNGGIGSALVGEFQKRGHRVFAGVRNPEKASDVASLLNVSIVKLDVTSSESIARALDVIKNETHGRGLDVLINNAGHGTVGPLIEADFQAGRHLFEVNFWGMLELCKAFMPLLIRAQGIVVNISSAGSVMHTPWLGVYDSSKAAVTMASETMRLELEPLGVKVITAMIGMTESKFTDNLPEIVLPEGSRYRPAEKYIQMAGTPGQGNLKKFEMPLDKLAPKLVGDILNGKTGLVWRGGMSTMVRYFSALMPTWFQVRNYDNCKVQC